MVAISNLNFDFILRRARIMKWPWHQLQLKLEPHLVLLANGFYSNFFSCAKFMDVFQGGVNFNIILVLHVHVQYLYL